MLKIGVVGAGHLGKIHLRLLDQSTRYQLIGFYNIDEKVAEEVALRIGERIKNQEYTFSYG